MALGEQLRACEKCGHRCIPDNVDYKICIGCSGGKSLPQMSEAELEEYENNTMEKILQKTNDEIPLDPNLELKDLVQACADLILQKHIIITGLEDDQIYLYSDGVYKKCPDNFIKNECERRIEKCSNHVRSEVLQKIKAVSYKSIKDFDADKNLLNLNNGILKLETLQIISHDPKYLSMIRIPVTFDQNAKCPMIEKFMSEILSDEIDRNYYYEMIADCLYREIRRHKGIVNTGTGRNGKSTLFDLIRAFLGNENCSNTELSTLQYNRFVGPGLINKLANFSSDLTKTELKQTGRIKQWISGDRVPIEPKGRDTYDYTPFTKFFVNTNGLPEVDDDSDAFFRRWHFIEFPNNFEGENDISQFIKQLTTESELSGLLNICIGKLKKIGVEGFSQSMSIAESRDTWKNDADPIRKFADEILERELNSMTVLSKLYNEYLSWCNDNKKTPKGAITLNRKLKQIFKLEDAETVNMGGKSVKVFKGIKLKQEEKTNQTVL